jgi:hypothetical protein
MSFKKFLESYLGGSRAPLYHFTKDLINLVAILHQDKLGLATYSYPEYNPATSPGPKVITGWFSLTRDARFNFGPIRFKLDGDKVATRYKLEPTVDFMVAVDNSGDNLLNTLPGNKRRWESEIACYGPITPLNRYLTEIGILTQIEKQLHDQVKWQTQAMKDSQEKLSKLYSGLFWHEASKEFRDLSTLKDPEKAKANFMSRYSTAILLHKGFVDQAKEVLAHPKLKVYSSFS